MSRDETHPTRSVLLPKCVPSTGFSWLTTNGGRQLLLPFCLGLLLPFLLWAKVRATWNWFCSLVRYNFFTIYIHVYIYIYIYMYVYSYEFVTYRWTAGSKKKRWDPFSEFTQGFRDTRDSTKNIHKRNGCQEYNIYFNLTTKEKKKNIYHKKGEGFTNKKGMGK